MWSMFNINAKLCRSISKMMLFFVRSFLQVWRKKLSHGSRSYRIGSVTSFADFSVRFSQAYMMQIQDSKRANNLSEVVEHPQESFKQYVNRFEAAVNLIVNPDQFMAYTTFIKRIMHDPNTHNHPMLSNLIVRHIEKYEDAQQTILHFLKLGAMQESSTPSGHKWAKKEDHDIKWRRHERRTIPLKLDLPQLIASHIYQSTKG